MNNYHFIPHAAVFICCCVFVLCLAIANKPTVTPALQVVPEVTAVPQQTLGERLRAEKIASLEREYERTQKAVRELGYKFNSWYEMPANQRPADYDYQLNAALIKYKDVRIDYDIAKKQLIELSQPSK